MSKCVKAFKIAFPKTIPIMAGFLFLGISYGVIMMNAGYPMLYPVSTSAGIYAGSLEFLFLDFFRNPFNPGLVLFLTLIINARHVFYGISMLEKFENTGWKKYFLIFGLCDESFAINCDAKLPQEVDRGWFMLHVTWLNYVYWVGGVLLGCLLSYYINIQVEGLGFVLTALFLAISVEQWLSKKDHIPAIVGFGSSALMFFLFKIFTNTPDYFALPSMILMLLVFRVIYNKEGVNKND